MSLRWPQNPVRRVCHHSDWLPAHCLLICLSFPGQSHSGLEPLQHKQAHWFAHTKGPRSTVTGLSFRFPSSAFRHLPPPPFPASPSGRKDLGHMPGAGRLSASHLEEMLHFSPLTQKKKNMVLRKLVFSTESSQRKKREKEGPAAPHSGLTTGPLPHWAAHPGKELPRGSLQRPSCCCMHLEIPFASVKRLGGCRGSGQSISYFPVPPSHPCLIQLLPSPGMYSSWP